MVGVESLMVISQQKILLQFLILWKSRSEGSLEIKSTLMPDTTPDTTPFGKHVVYFMFECGRNEFLGDKFNLRAMWNFQTGGGHFVLPLFLKADTINKFFTFGKCIFF